MAVEAGSISALVTSLHAAGEIVKMMVGIRDGAMIQSKVIELNGVIISAQSAALAANQSQFALLERVRELEKEIADMKEWDAEKQKYELKAVSSGAFAYTLKEDAGTAGPSHWLCANCYDQHRKSFLQYKGKMQNGRERIFYCPACKAQILTYWNGGPL